MHGLAHSSRLKPLCGSSTLDSVAMDTDDVFFFLQHFSPCVHDNKRAVTGNDLSLKKER